MNYRLRPCGRLTASGPRRAARPFGIEMRRAAQMCGAVRRLEEWCGRRDSNPHALRRLDLNQERLPVPPRPRSRGIAGRVVSAKDKI